MSLVPDVARRVVHSPIGLLLLEAGQEGLQAIHFLVGENPRVSGMGRPSALTFLNDAERQIEAYFCGELKIFDLPLAPRGSPFQKQVWDLLRSIPYGETLSYGQVAWRLARSGAARAIGSACKRNPLPIVIPCHRVVGKNGDLVGYAGGKETKKKLLEYEQTQPTEIGDTSAPCR